MKERKTFGAIAAALALGLAIMAGLSVSANAHEGHEHHSNKAKKVAIGFKALNGNKAVSCNKPITGLGKTSRTAQLTDLRFYVSGVQLLRKGGGAVNVKLQKGTKWSYTKGNAGVTLIDLENGTGACAADGTKATNAFVRGTVPEGKYVGVRYSVSVPYPLNHTSVTTEPAPLNSMAMAWNWQFGRKFVKIELTQDDSPDWAAEIFYLHVGSTDCTGDPGAGEKAKCALPNRDKITLKKFNPASQRIAIDLKSLFSGVDIASNVGTPGCMSETTDPECPSVFKSLGLKLGTKQTTNQTAFRVVRK